MFCRITYSKKCDKPKCQYRTKKKKKRHLKRLPRQKAHYYSKGQKRVYLILGEILVQLHWWTAVTSNHGMWLWIADTKLWNPWTCYLQKKTKTKSTLKGKEAWPQCLTKKMGFKFLTGHWSQIMILRSKFLSIWLSYPVNKHINYFTCKNQITTDHKICVYQFWS